MQEPSFFSPLSRKSSKVNALQNCTDDESWLEPAETNTILEKNMSTGFWDEPAGFWVSMVVGGVALGLFGPVIIATIVGFALGTATVWLISKVLGIR